MHKTDQSIAQSWLGKCSHSPVQTYAPTSRFCKAAGSAAEAESAGATATAKATKMAENCMTARERESSFDRMNKELDEILALSVPSQLLLYTGTKGIHFEYRCTFDEIFRVRYRYECSKSFLLTDWANQSRVWSPGTLRASMLS